MDRYKRIAEKEILLNNDKKELEIQLTDEEIQYMSKCSFRKYLKWKIKFISFTFLVEESNKREKTRHVKFLDFKISEYLGKKMKTSLSTFIFSIRSKTLDLKDWQPCKYGSMNFFGAAMHMKTCWKRTWETFFEMKLRNKQKSEFS